MSGSKVAGRLSRSTSITFSPHERQTLYTCRRSCLCSPHPHSGLVRRFFICTTRAVAEQQTKSDSFLGVIVLLALSPLREACDESISASQSQSPRSFGD